MTKELPELSAKFAAISRPESGGNRPPVGWSKPGLVEAREKGVDFVLFGGLIRQGRAIEHILVGRGLCRARLALLLERITIDLSAEHSDELVEFGLDMLECRDHLGNPLTRNILKVARLINIGDRVGDRLALLPAEARGDVLNRDSPDGSSQSPKKVTQ